MPTTTGQITAKARYYLPGSLFAEDTTLELDERSVQAAVKAAPQHAFAFVLVDVPVVDFDYDTARFRVVPIAQNESGKHYLGGEVFTCDGLRALAVAEGAPDKYRTLIANVTRYVDGLPVEGRAIRCRTGNWQPFEDGDQIVDIEGAGA